MYSKLINIDLTVFLFNLLMYNYTAGFCKRPLYTSVSISFKTSTILLSINLFRWFRDLFDKPNNWRENILINKMCNIHSTIFSNLITASSLTENPSCSSSRLIMDLRTVSSSIYNESRGMSLVHDMFGLLN